ncbi:MAG: ribbon-helix-helix protein, CopG family [bacterium]
MKVLISVPKDQLRHLDRLAKASGKSRSKFLIDSALAGGIPQPPARPIDDPRVRRAYEFIVKTRHTWKPGLPTTAMIRQMREHRY